MKSTKQIIGENLAELRKDKKLTQLELAEKFGYSDKSISKWEKGDNLPDIETLCLLCEFYGVTLDYLTHEGNREEKTRYLAPKMKKEERTYRIIVGALIVSVIWMIATFVFVYLLIFNNINYWLAFVWAVPASCILSYVYVRRTFSSEKARFIIMSLFWWSLATCLFLQLSESGVEHLSYINMWPIFILVIPIQVVITFTYVMKLKKK